jgi:hypothetical protein
MPSEAGMRQVGGRSEAAVSAAFGRGTMSLMAPVAIRDERL